MRKPRGGASINPSTKYFVSTCQDRIEYGSTTDWVQVRRDDDDSLKKLETYDKSRVLRAVLDKHTEIIVKLGDHDEIKHEYEMGKSLSGIKGFVKFICFFECKDDVLQSSMKVIVMPFFKMGSLSRLPFDSKAAGKNIFISCIKHAIMSIIEAFFITGIGHNDFHTGNVVLKKTNLKTIVYRPFQDEAPFEIETNGVRTWIMDWAGKLKNITEEFV